MANGQWKIFNYMNLSALHPYLVTKNEVNNLSLLLRKLTGQLFKEGFDLDKFLAQETSYELNQSIKNLLKENRLSTASDKSTLQTFFLQVQEPISSLPVVHIILAFPPKVGLVKFIHDWFYQNFKKTVTLDISVDPSLIGGGVISFGGKANDYSLKNTIEQVR